MKTKKILMAFALVAGLALSSNANAQTAPFGVVDMNKVMQVTSAAKDIFSQLEGKRKEYQAQITKEEDALRTAEQEILKQKDKLGKEEFDKKRDEFEQKILNGQKLVQDRKRTLDVAFNNSMNSLRNEAAKIVAEIAKEKKYSAVLTQDAVMISTPDLDMTDLVIERLDKTLSKMPVNWSSTSTDATPKKK